MTTAEGEENILSQVLTPEQYASFALADVGQFQWQDSTFTSASQDQVVCTSN